MIGTTLAVRRNVAEERQEGVVILLRDRVDFVIVTTRATDSHAKESFTGSPQNVVKIIVARQRTIGRFVIPNTQPVKAGSGYGIAVLIRQLISGKLFLDESVIRLVLVKGANDVVAVFPNEILAAVAFVAISLGKAHEVQPMTAPLFAVLRAC